MHSSYDSTLGKFDLRRPWVLSLLTMACIPLFPEYIAPFLALIALLFAKRDAKHRRSRLRVGAAGKVMIGYLSLMTVHLIWATDRLFSAFSLLYWAAMLCVYLAMTSILCTRRRIETALFVLSAVVGILGVLACTQYVCVAFFGMTDVPLQVWDFADEFVFGLVPFTIHLHSMGIRAAATFCNPNLFAQYIMMATPFVAAYAFTGHRSAAKIFARVSLLLGVMGLFFSFSRGAYLALCAIAVVMCIANIRRLIPILMVAFSVLLLLPSTVYERLATIGNAGDAAITERLDVWGITMQVFFKRPLLGHGMGIGAIWPALSESGFNAPHAHNVFLQFLTEGGIVGLILLLFLIWKLFRTGFELIIHTPDTRMYGAAVVAFCGGFCVCGMVDHLLFAPKVIGMFMMVLSFTDVFGFVQMNRPSRTVSQSLPFIGRIRRRLERWIVKKTAPDNHTDETAGA